MTTLALSIAGIALIYLWTISMQRSLAALDENAGSAMSQIEVQLSGRFDALMMLLYLTRDYTSCECEMLIETVSSRRRMITAKSTPDDVLKQEEIITEALNRIEQLTAKYPELKSDPDYIEMTGAVEAFENMIRTSCLVYNDSVKKLNHRIHIFPFMIIAGIYGLRKKDYLK